MQHSNFVFPSSKSLRSQQKTPFGRTFPFLTKWFPPLSRGWHCPQGVLLTRGVPPIHFGKEDGVERTLLRVACQSETFLAPPWQGSVDIRVLWHIGCQSDFDELVSMSSRPVDRGSGRMESISTTFHPAKGGFGRMGETKVPFHPVKSRSGRMGSISTTFHPAKGRFGRMGMHI